MRRAPRALVALGAVALLLAGGCVRRATAGRAPGGGPAGGEEAGSGRQNGEAAPRTLDVEQLRAEMKKARGRPLFVHLWATWCAPCLDELPLIDGFARAARARGAVVLSVSLDNDARGVARIPATLQAHAPTLTPLVARFDDPEPFISLLSPSWEGAIPALFAFDRAGRLRGSLIGEVAPAELEALLARLTTSPDSPSRKRSVKP